MTGLEYIRQQYKVPARVGGRIVYNGTPGVIVGADSERAYLIAKLDGYAYDAILHPTWNVEYLDDIEVPACRA